MLDHGTVSGLSPGDEPLRLARDDRKELVGILAAEGMSTRAIAPIVGVDRKTIERDISGATNVAPEREVHGLDGKSYLTVIQPGEPTPRPAAIARAAYRVLAMTSLRPNQSNLFELEQPYRQALWLAQDGAEDG